MVRAAKATVGVLAVLAFASALWYAQTTILLTFAGILLAIVLYGASRWLRHVFSKGEDGNDDGA